MTDPRIDSAIAAATVWLNGTDAEKSAMFSSLAARAELPGRDKPYDAVMEERMAAAAEGRTLRNLPTDPAVRGRGRRDRRDEVGNVTTDGGATWHYEPEAS